MIDPPANSDELQQQHTENYRRRYSPKPVTGTSGQPHLPSGSTWHQWGRHLPEDLQAAAGYKPADGRAEIRRRLAQAASS